MEEEKTVAVRMPLKVRIRTVKKSHDQSVAAWRFTNSAQVPFLRSGPVSIPSSRRMLAMPDGDGRGVWGLYPQQDGHGGRWDEHGEPGHGNVAGERGGGLQSADWG